MDIPRSHHHKRSLPRIQFTPADVIPYTIALLMLAGNGYFIYLFTRLFLQ